MNESSFHLLERIGKGSFGEVFKAQPLQGTDRRVCVIKRVDFSSLSTKDQEEAQNEVRILSQLRSPYIVKYLGFFMDRKLCLNIVMEFADRGSLYQKIQSVADNGKHFTEKAVWSIFIQLLIALYHVHQAGVLHRDVKSANVFLQSRATTGSPLEKPSAAADEIVKLGDFGVSKDLLTRKQLATTFIGTPYYLSPEICLNKPYGVKSDVWAAGVILYELCTLKHPFDASSQASLIIQIIGGRYAPIGKEYSTPLSRVLRACLSTDVKRRPDTSALLRHSVIVKVAAELNLRLPPELVTPAATSSGPSAVPAAPAVADRAAAINRKPKVKPSGSGAAPSPLPARPLSMAPSPIPAPIGAPVVVAVKAPLPFAAAAACAPPVPSTSIPVLANEAVLSSSVLPLKDAALPNFARANAGSGTVANRRVRAKGKQPAAVVPQSQQPRPLQRPTTQQSRVSYGVPQRVRSSIDGMAECADPVNAVNPQRRVVPPQSQKQRARDIAMVAGLPDYDVGDDPTNNLVIDALLDQAAAAGALNAGNAGKANRPVWGKGLSTGLVDMNPADTASTARSSESGNTLGKNALPNENPESASASGVIEWRVMDQEELSSQPSLPVAQSKANSRWVSGSTNLYLPAVRDAEGDGDDGEDVNGEDADEDYEEGQEEQGNVETPGEEEEGVDISQSSTSPDHVFRLKEADDNNEHLDEPSLLVNESSCEDPLDDSTIEDPLQAKMAEYDQELRLRITALTSDGQGLLGPEVFSSLCAFLGSAETSHRTVADIRAHILSSAAVQHSCVTAPPDEAVLTEATHIAYQVLCLEGALQRSQQLRASAVSAGGFQLP